MEPIELPKTGAGPRRIPSIAGGEVRLGGKVPAGRLAMVRGGCRLAVALSLPYRGPRHLEICLADDLMQGLLRKCAPRRRNRRMDTLRARGVRRWFGGFSGGGSDQRGRAGNGAMYEGSKTRRNCERQSGNATPNVCLRRELERTENAGRRAGVGYSAEEMGVTRCVMSGRREVASANHGVSREHRPASSRIAQAKSYQVVSPCAVR